MLDALACRVEPESVRGTILVDGRRPPTNFKFLTGYVVQVAMKTMIIMVIIVVAGNTIVTYEILND